MTARKWIVWAAGALLFSTHVREPVANAQSVTRRYSPRTDRDGRYATLPGEEFESDARLETLVKKHVPRQVRVAKFDRVLAEPTHRVQISGDRVAVLGSSGRVWTIGQGDKVEPLGSIESYSTHHLCVSDSDCDFQMGFDARGVLSVQDCCDPALWQWKGRWVVVAPKGQVPASPAVAFPPSVPEPAKMHVDARATDGRGQAWILNDGVAWVYAFGDWCHIIDAPRDLHDATAQGKDIMWLASDNGLYRARLHAPTEVLKGDPLIEPAPELPASPTQVAPLRLSSSDWPVTPKRITLSVAGAAFDRADSVAAAPDGALWFVDRGRLIVVQDGKAQLIADKIDGFAAHGLAPLSATQGWIAWRKELQALSDGKRVAQPELLLDVSAVGIRDGHGWAAACRCSAEQQEDSMPAATQWTGSIWRWAPEIPHVCYRAVTLSPDGSAWLVGGEGGDNDWPFGEGVIVHVTGKRVDTSMNPSTALLSVAATDAGDAWAGGYDGRLVHIQGTSQKEYRLDDEPWVLGAYAKGNTVYVVGESLIGKIEGERLQRIAREKLPLGTWKDATVDAAGNLWVVGVGGILRIDRT
jgi:hypothetical protein